MLAQRLDAAQSGYTSFSRKNKARAGLTGQRQAVNDQLTLRLAGIWRHAILWASAGLEAGNRPGGVFVVRSIACIAAFGVVLGGLAAGAPAHAQSAASPAKMTFSRLPPSAAACAGPCAIVILARGEIQPDSVADFLSLKAQAKAGEIAVVLDSPGGSLEGGLALGRAFRRLGVHTVAGSAEARGAGQCNSACVYAFAGGVTRTMAQGGSLGVHQFFMARADDYERRPRQRYSGQEFGQMQRSLAGLATYLVEMGVSLDLLTVAADVAPEQVRRLDRAQAEAMRLVTATGVAAAPDLRPAIPAPVQPPPRSAGPAKAQSHVWPLVLREGRPWLILTTPSQSRRFGEIANEVAIGCPPANGRFVAKFREITHDRGSLADAKAVIAAPAAGAEKLTLTGSAGELRGVISHDIARAAATYGALDLEVTSTATAGYPMRISFPGQGLPEAVAALEQACQRR